MSSFQTGSRIGPYEILGSLGAGGMGAVYRARDTKLGRDVALKMLPDEFAQDADRLSRFGREAQVLASLNHPNIGQIYGLEEAGGTPCLVLELVEGLTLQERLSTGPVPVAEALGIARQIADGVEAAHQRGVIHRDLKPANIKQTPDGKVKVLDFGLAKAFEGEETSTSLSHSPTVLSGRTRANVLVGTLPYMSPEQVRGRAADERSDIWAFGCVLYELLTARPAFAGDAAADLIGAITKTEPDWTLLPAETPPTIRTLLRRCLQKDKTRRLHHIADARIEIAEALDGSMPEHLDTSAAKGNPAWWVAGMAASAALAAGLMWMAGPSLMPEPGTPSQMRLEISTPPSSSMDLSISPDGRLLVFEGSRQGKSQLFLRSLNSLAVRSLAGTEGAIFPFWSPDSRSMAFFSQGKLKRLDINGGTAQVLADASNPRGGVWSADGTIIFNPVSQGPLYRMPAAGGEATAVTRLEKDQGSHRYPNVLPDGHHFLYFALGKPDVSGVYVGSTDSMDGKRLLAADSRAAYAHPGFVLFLRQGTLFAQKFDAKKLELVGEPFQLGEQVTGLPSYTGSAAVSVAADGTVAYRTSGGNDARFMWFDRSGKELGSVGPVGQWSSVALSPDGSHAAAQRSMNGNVDLWLIELARGLATRLTTDPADDEWPVWSADGKFIAFDSNRRGSFDLYRIPAGAGAEELLLESSQTKTPSSWSADQRYLLYEVTDSKTGADLWALGVGDRKAFPVVNRNFDQSNGQLSRDTRWIAYDSNESGQSEIFVQAFPEPADKWQVSLEGGSNPVWSPDGRELFFVALDGKLMAASLTVSGDGKKIDPAKPVALFQTRIVPVGKNALYSVTSDAKRFLVVVPVESTPPPITILLNWAKR